MFGNPFYFSLIRKYVIIVGTLFNNIRVIRTDSANNTTQVIKVPITYGPKDKMLARVIDDPNIDRQTAIVLPIISFQLGKMVYDGSRKLDTINQIRYKKDANNFKYQYTPVPYNFDFQVSIYVKNVEDGTKIIEQILPYFTPNWTTQAKLIPDVEEIRKIDIVLNDIDYEDRYDGNFKERRAIIWTLHLTVKGYLYGPIREFPIIKFANTSFYIPTGVVLHDELNPIPPVLSTTVQPGLDANGNPTSNSLASIPLNQIEAGDDFGYIIQTDDYAVPPPEVYVYYGVDTTTITIDSTLVTVDNNSGE